MRGDAVDETVSRLASDGFQDRMVALERVAASIAVGATTATMRPLIETGFAAGVTPGQFLGTLLVVGPIVGSARLVTAAPELARAIGYDIDRAFECLE